MRVYVAQHLAKVNVAGPGPPFYLDLAFRIGYKKRLSNWKGLFLREISS
jgi:hypothetical protein